MSRWIAVVAGVSALGIAAAVAPTAQAATAGSCSLTGQVTVAPGLTFSPKDFTFKLDGTFEACKMPNGETRTGKIAVTKGTGTGSCGSSTVEAPFTVSWNGGRTHSTGHASGVTTGPFGFVTGELDGGEYGGTPFQTFFTLNPQGPLQCGTSGVTSAQLTGQITFR